MTASRQRSEDGLWILEGQCGDCGNVEVGPTAVPEQGDLMIVWRERARRKQPLCHGFYKGRPKDRCGWTLTWQWIWMPREKATGMARTVR